MHDPLSLLSHAEIALRAVGQSPKRRKSHVLLPTAILTPAWAYARDGDAKLVLRVRGRLSLVELGALHLRGLL